MPTPLEEIAPVPKAPHPPDIEDVLGPPPRAPRIGRHGALSGPIGSGRHGRGGRAARPPSPPHLAKPSPPPAQAQHASQPVRQTIIQEVKPAPYKPPVATKESTPPDNQGYSAPRGMGNRRRQASVSARKNANDWQARSAGAKPTVSPKPTLKRTDLGEGDVENATKGAYDKLKPESQAVQEGFVQPNSAPEGEATS